MEKIDLIYLNLLETKANETEIKLIEAQQIWFDQLAAFQAAAGLDPLDQATLLGQLPDSDSLRVDDAGKRNQDADALDQDWNRRIGNPAE